MTRPARRRSAGRATGAPTIADVARRSGYSPMTVSRVLNGNARVRDKARQAVMRAVAALGYTPNLAARALAGVGQVKLCLLYANPSAAYLSELLVGALDQAHDSHAQLLVEPCADGQSPGTLIAALADAGIDGMLLPPPLCDSRALHRAVLRAGLPVVTIASGQPLPGVAVVRIDDRAAALTMTRHLLTLGHRRIGFITGSPDQTASAERLEGYRDALRSAGIAVDRRLVRQGQFTYRSGMKAAEALLGANPVPTAIFASNDDMAAAAIATAQRRGLSVPRDLTVCGFDDTPLAMSTWPELTTIRQPIAAMARASVELLLAQISAKREGRDTPTASRLLPFRFVQRGSDAPPPAGT